jgi:hypothetical protein
MPKVQHIVLLKFKADAAEDTWPRLVVALAGLRTAIPGIIHFSAGPYASPEGFNQGYTHGFLMTFSDPAARDVYLDHPAHEAVKSEFLPAAEKVVAFDFEEA